MTIQQAIKTGKPFKRPYWTEQAWTVCHKGMFKFENYFGLEDKPDQFSVEDIISEDWMVKDE